MAGVASQDAIARGADCLSARPPLARLNGSRRCPCILRTFGHQTAREEARGPGCRVRLTTKALARSSAGSVFARSAPLREGRSLRCRSRGRASWPSKDCRCLAATRRIFQHDSQGPVPFDPALPVSPSIAARPRRTLSACGTGELLLEGRRARWRNQATVNVTWAGDRAGRALSDERAWLQSRTSSSVSWRRRRNVRCVDVANEPNRVKTITPKILAALDTELDAQLGGEACVIRSASWRATSSRARSRWQT